MKLIIGNKRYSSWSLRPWVLMKHFEIPFEEHLIPLDQPETTKNILQFSPSGRVPILVDGATTVWDSLAIAEYLNEKFPQKNLWPLDSGFRAKARSLACEMHSSFQTMRELMPHDLQKKVRGFDWSKAKTDIERIKSLLSSSLKESGGPYLFGSFSVADAMYAPVINRFLTYDVKLESELAEYAERIRSLPAHRQWIEDALNEKHVMARYAK